MARIVKRTRDGPYPVTIGGESKHICGCGLRKTPASSIGTTSRATASKPLTIFRIFAVQRSEPEAATPQRLVGVPIRYDLRKRGCRYYGLNDAESGSGRL